MQVNAGHILAVTLIIVSAGTLSHEITQAARTGALPASPAGAPPLRRFVSTNPSFVLFKPEDWKVHGAEANGELRIAISDPLGTSLAEQVFAGNPQGRYNSAELLVAKANEIKARHPDLVMTDVELCKDREISCAAASLAYTVHGIPVQGRFYFHADSRLTTIRSYSAPTSRLQAQRALLLDILTNIHVRSATAPEAVRLADRRASDGSLSLSLPADWSLVAQRGAALAVSPGGGAGFIFTSFDVLPSNYGIVPPPNVIISRYEQPADFAPKIFAKYGNREIRVLSATPDPQTAAECPRRIGRMCDAADVQLSWISPQGVASTGSFKLLNARPGAIGHWFSIIAGIWGPSDELARYMPTLEQIGASFRIDDAYAARYIQNGLANLRVLQQKTARTMQSLYDAIHENQADYERRVARKEASEAKWDDYRRGNSYWISDLEGGKIYATDPWGTKDTYKEERYEGTPYDYIHFEGQNPAHPSENMREISSYELKEMGYR